MNLADIRKKAEENRKSAAAVSLTAAVEAELLPEENIPDSFIIEEPPADSFEMPVADLPAEPGIYHAQSLEDFAPVPESSQYSVAQQSEPLPVSDVLAAAGNKQCEAIATVQLPVMKKPGGFSPIETILSGRESALDFEDTALFHAHAFASDDVAEYLCFRVAQEEYAISIMAIKEIIKPRDVTEVPRMPSFISGVISLRGVIIPVMDMRIRLSLPACAVAGKERIIVLRSDSGFCGVLVDEVIQVARIKKSDIEEPPAVLEGIDREFVAGLGHFDNRMLILLNLEAILDIGVN